MRNKKSDTCASTGVGAFVIFIAIIIVSSVTMATITITIQKISESVEKNSSEPALIIYFGIVNFSLNAYGSM